MYKLILIQDNKYSFRKLFEEKESKFRFLVLRNGNAGLFFQLF